MQWVTEVFATYPTEVIAWCGIALFVGGFVKGVLGVGLPMVSVPLMSFMVAPYVAAALVVLPVFPANIIQLQSGGPLLTKIKRFWPISLGIAVGTFISAPYLIAADPRVLQFIVASISGLYALQRIRKQNIFIKPAREKPVGLLWGFGSGALGGIAMLIGPLIVIYMAALRMERDVFVGSIAFVYLVTTLTIGLALANYDQLTPTLIWASVLACIPAVGGVVTGAWCRKYISQEVFDKLLTVLIIVISVSMFYRALG